MSPNSRIPANPDRNKYAPTDPEVVARLMEKRRRIAERHARFVAEEAALVGELQAAGLQVTSVCDLVNGRTRYPSAIPILVNHLSLSYSDSVREFIARALAVKEARPYWPVILNAYLKEPWDPSVHPDKSSAKQGLACAVIGTVTRETLPQLIEAVTDCANGPTRRVLLDPLQRSRDPAVHQVLESLADDPDLAGVIALWKKSRAKRKAAKAKRDQK